MPPRKKNVNAARKSPRAGRKRKNDSVDTLTDPKRIQVERSSKNRLMTDNYCWICHMLVQEEGCKTCKDQSCKRVYHSQCLENSPSQFTDDDTCPECQLASVDGTKSCKSNASLQTLKFVLKKVVSRIKTKKSCTNEIFFRWPENVGNDLVQIVDLEVLVDRIDDTPLYYANAVKFYSDVKWIYHNCYILYGATATQTKAADSLRKEFRIELLDVESCEECYFHLYCKESLEPNPFLIICDPPHDLVWAKLSRFPYWPAKVLTVRKQPNEIAYVRFFGKHEKANIPISKCYHLSDGHPEFPDDKITDRKEPTAKFMQKDPYRTALYELQNYIDLYEEKYGVSSYTYHPIKTLYKPEDANSVKENAKQVEKPSFTQRPIMLSSSSFVGGTDWFTARGLLPDNQSTNQQSSVSCKANSNNQGQYMDMCVDDRPISVNTTFAPSENQLEESSISCENNAMNSGSETVVASTSLVNMSPSFSSSPSSSARLHPSFLAHPSNQRPRSVNRVLPHYSRRNIQHSSFLNRTQASENIRPLHFQSNRTVPSVTAPETNPESLVTSTVREGTNDDDDDVIIILDSVNNSHTPNRNLRQQCFNPSLVLPHLLDRNDQVKGLYNQTKALMEGIFLRILTTASRWPTSPEVLSSPLAEIQNYKDEITKLQKEIAECRGLEDKVLDKMIQCGCELESLKMNLQEEKQKRIQIQTNAEESVDNSKKVIAGLRECLNGKWKKKLVSENEEVKLKLNDTEGKLKDSLQYIQELRKEIHALKVDKLEMEEKYKSCACLDPASNSQNYNQHCKKDSDAHHFRKSSVCRTQTRKQVSTKQSTTFFTFQTVSVNPANLPMPGVLPTSSNTMPSEDEETQSDE